MTDKPRELERQIDDTRSEMDETIDALTARLNPRAMGERAANAVMRRAPEPPEAGRSFYARRPMLVGSIALAAGAGAGFLLSPPDTEGKTRSHGPGLMDRAKGRYHQARDQVKESASNMTESAKETLHMRTSSSGGGGGQAVQEAREQAKEHAEGMKKVTQSTYEVAKREARDVAQEAKEGARHVKETAKRESEAQDVTPEDAAARARRVREAQNE